MTERGPTGHTLSEVTEAVSGARCKNAHLEFSVITQVVCQ